MIWGYMVTKRNATPYSFISLGEKQVSHHSGEWLHSTGANRFKGWHCSAGLQSLYIDFDGNVFVATCAVGGWFGNIFREGLAPEKRLNQWIQCTNEICACGADLAAPKVRRRELIPQHFDDLFLPAEDGSDFQVVEQAVPDVVVSEMARPRCMVIWDLGRRCNYDCSYCYRDSHNNYEAYKTMGSLRHAVDGVHAWWLGDRAATFNITGGEPTIHPHYLELVKYITAKNPNNVVCTTTNGSRDPAFYAQLMELSTIIFSGHMETLQLEHTHKRFLENVNSCVEARKRSPQAAGQSLQVRLMLRPGLLEPLKRLQADLLAIPDIRLHAILNVDMLHHSAAKELLVYSDEEIAFLKLNAQPAQG